jgi:hypothetical protein
MRDRQPRERHDPDTLDTAKALDILSGGAAGAPHSRAHERGHEKGDNESDGVSPLAVERRDGNRCKECRREQPNQSAGDVDND